MKKPLLFLFLLGLSISLFAQIGVYSRVKIYTDSKAPAALFATGIEITGADKENHWYVAEISQKDISKLSAAGFRYEVMIPDMAKYYAERSLQKTTMPATKSLLTQAWPEPANFSLGTCGGFSTVDEMLQQLDLMRELYPNLISVKQALSDTVTTIEGRTVYYVRISDNPDINESEPEVLYTGMHHAREPIGMQHLLYYMWYLLENYYTDASLKALVDTTEMYFVPVFNVDGYTDNIINYPAGGGMWRKNKRDNGDGSFGIDINRNYSYQWGFDDTGSSPDPSSDLFRGTAPFSEPETRMMKYFCEGHNFLIALNYHSYSNLFLYSWGWSSTPTPDNSLLDAYAQLMTKENGYTYGAGNTTIYPTNGGSDDWMYGEQLTKPAIMSYTPEIGNSEDGFWPTQDRIIPLCKENMLASLTAARLAGNYGILADNSPLFIWEQSGHLTFEVKRLGMQDGSFTVSVAPLGDAFASVGSAKTIQGLGLLEKSTDSISYQLNSSLHVGDTLRYVLTIDNGSFAEHDTVTRIFGFPLTVFNDKLTNNSNWTGNWSITNAQYYSPFSSMTDTPNGNYTAFSTKTITLVNEISLTNTMLLVLQFRAKWAIENDYDYVQLSITENNGTTWIPLDGIYTNQGSIYQLAGQPLYDGTQSGWVREAISLNSYMGKNVKFRFRFKSDGGTQMDGYYFDDFNISMLLDPTSVSENNASAAFLGIPYPNPANSTFEVSYNLPETIKDAHLKVITPTGITVSQLLLNQQSGTTGIDISNLAPGMYFVRIEASGLQSPVRKLIVK